MMPDLIRNRRQLDNVRIGLLTIATGVAGTWPARMLFAQSAQSQDYINGSVAQQLATLTTRLDRIDNMVNAVLVALVIQLIVQVIQIRRAPDKRH